MKVPALVMAAVGASTLSALAVSTVVLGEAEVASVATPAPASAPRATTTTSTSTATRASSARAASTPLAHEDLLSPRGHVVPGTAVLLFDGAPLTGSSNPFDVAGLEALSAARQSPADLCTDEEFLRRVTADLCGRLPSEAEHAAFVADASPTKRAAKVDELLASTAYAAHWGRDLMASWLCAPDRAGNAALIDYLEESIAQDRPITQVVQELSEGTTNITNPTAAAALADFDGINGSAVNKANRLMETFAGQPVQCAQCHDMKTVLVNIAGASNHDPSAPEDDPRWTFEDSRGLVAFFAATPGQATPVLYGQDMPLVQPTWVTDGYAEAPRNLPFLTDDGLADAERSDVTGTELAATLPARRARFGELLGDSQAFARGFAHRAFAEVMAPLLDPDVILARDLARNALPGVLDASTRVFQGERSRTAAGNGLTMIMHVGQLGGGFKLKGYLRTLATSKLYQLASHAPGQTQDDASLLARHPMRRHHAEALRDGLRLLGARDGRLDDFFLRTFGYPVERDAIDERNHDVNVAQALLLMNDPDAAPSTGVGDADQVKPAALARLVAQGALDLPGAYTRLFVVALGRAPTADELAQVDAWIPAGTPALEALEDLSASLRLTTEFVAR